MGKKKNGMNYRFYELFLLHKYRFSIKSILFTEYSHIPIEERKIRTVAEIVQFLINAQAENKDVNLNALKTRIAAKYGLETSPRLVDIIAAVPADYKKLLLPKLLAKPIRTASGVSYPETF